MNLWYFTISIFVIYSASAQLIIQDHRRKQCPNYAEYATYRHKPLSEGPLKLSFQRPTKECRTFVSDVVDELIDYMNKKIVDKDIARVFENTFPNTLDTTISWHSEGSSTEEPQTFVVTGDINAEWLRDSANQLSAYMSLISKDEKLKKLIKGAINTQAKYIIANPYCNAFKPPHGSGLEGKATLNGDTVSPPVNPKIVFECKYEIDSLASFLDLTSKYYNNTKDKSVFTETWKEAFRLLINVLSDESKPTYNENGDVLPSAYTFKRNTDTGTETLSLGGRGFPVNLNTSLIKSAFRPSDDATIYQFFIPGNAMMSVKLNEISKALEECGLRELSISAWSYSDVIRKGIFEHGVYEHPVFGKVFAYEVDGYGGIINMDDANIPSLLSLPVLGFISKDDEIYQNTRKMILTKKGNPYYLKGRQIEGIGGPHVGIKYVWPMSLIMRMRTSDDDEEISKILKTLVSTTANLGLMHEGINVNFDRDFTRPWFAWCNSEFGLAILDLAERKPHLLFGSESNKKLDS